MRGFALRWACVAVAHELLEAWIVEHPLTALAGATGATAALTVAALAGFWIARVALIFVLPGCALVRGLGALRR